MKKLICILLAIAMCAFAGCSNEEIKETEPQETEPEIVTTFELEEIQMTAENVSPYEGAYLEYGDVEMVSGMYAVKFTNNASQTIREAQLIFSDGTQELTFWLEMLAAGQSVVVCNQDQIAVASEQIQYVDGMVTYLEEGMENAASVEVTGGEGVATVTNVTEEDLPLVRVFFRPTDENGNMIGGLCQSFMADGIPAGETVEVEAEGWTDGCAVSTVLVINE